MKQNNNNNILIAIPSPRDLPIVLDALNKITEYDKLWVKYSPEHITYPIIREQFLKNKNKYTHLVICPDDLLIDDPKKLELLLEDSKELGDNKAIVSGYCNVDTSENAKYANITKNEVSNERHGRQYQWITLEYLEHQTSDILIEVKFAGFPLMVIPRSAVEQIPFRNDSFTGQFDYFGCCVDIMFCNDAISNGYKIYVDTRVRLQHLKHSDNYTSEIMQRHPKTENDWTFYYEYAKKK